MRVDNFQGKPGDFQLYLKSPQFAFRPGGACGTEVSDLFPHVRTVVDDLCVIRSMSSDHTNHYEGTLGMHTGSFTFARPSIGSWVSYGLGTENREPALVRGGGAARPVCRHADLGLRLPAGLPPGDAHRARPDADRQRPPPGRLRRAPAARAGAGRRGQSPAPRAPRRPTRRSRPASARSRRPSACSARRPEVFDLSGESDATLALYGLERGRTDGFAWQCLVGRRLAERGVRFIELIDSGSSNNWDAHGNMMEHVPMARNVDRAIAGLIVDLKSRGLLDDTLVVWTTEFGRTPYNSAPGAAGREHHHQCFSSWLAGGGVKGGIVHGATDEYGIAVAEDRVHVHDFHATILHLLGLDHTRLTYRHAGRDYRLTDVSGNVVKEILA